MIYSSIDNKPIQELTIDNFVRFFVEHMFEKFMDSGRTGLRSAAGDIVDNLIFRLEKLGTLKSVGVVDDKDITQLRKALTARTTQSCMDTFITKGTAGLYDTIFEIVSAHPNVFHYYATSQYALR